MMECRDMMISPILVMLVLCTVQLFSSKQEGWEMSEAKSDALCRMFGSPFPFVRIKYCDWLN
jgi:hypothetical protein